MSTTGRVLFLSTSSDSNKKGKYRVGYLPFFVSFDFSSGAMSEMQSFFKKSGKSIIALTVKDILDEQIAYKLA